MQSEQLYAARVEDCDLERGVLKVANKTRKKTGRKVRPIVLTGRMIALCRELIGDRTTGYLFRNKFGDPWN